MSEYLRQAISNGIPREQALIRRWWHESMGACGILAWEYHMEGKYADAVLFCGDGVASAEESGPGLAKRFSLEGSEIILCEAKGELTPELVGQALGYTRFAIRAGANVRDTIVFAERGSEPMKRVTAELGLNLIVRALEES